MMGWTHPSFRIWINLMMILSLVITQRLDEQLVFNALIADKLKSGFFEWKQLGAENLESGSCHYNAIKKNIQFPIFFINLDNSVDRRKNFEHYFGCLNLTRVPGINGRNSFEVAKWLSNPIWTTPNLAESYEGEIVWSGWARRPPPPPENVTNPAFLGALGCVLAHLRAIATVHLLGLPYAIIMEDDMTPELYPYWNDLNLKLIIEQIPHTLSAIELSSLTGEGAWDEIEEKLVRDGKGILLAENQWLASNGAYLISRKGAREVMEATFDHSQGKFNLNDLQCVNADLCLTGLFRHRWMHQPPLFLHERTLPNFSQSGIVADLPHLARQQHYVVELARNRSFSLAKIAMEMRRKALASLLYVPSMASECRYPEVKAVIDMPVLYIGYDWDRDVAEVIESLLGCLELYRIPKINSSDPSQWARWIHGSKEDTAPVTASVTASVTQSEVTDKKPPSGSASASAGYFETVDRLLGHLRAASSLLQLQLPHALVIEDGVSFSLLPHWLSGIGPGPAGSLSGMLEQLPKGVSAVQVGYAADGESLEQLERYGEAVGRLLVRELWFPSQTAYVLTLYGAAQSAAQLSQGNKYHIGREKIRCLRPEECLVTKYEDRRVMIPPLFVPTVTQLQPLSAEEPEPGPRRHRYGWRALSETERKYSAISQERFSQLWQFRSIAHSRDSSYKIA